MNTPPRQPFATSLLLHYRQYLQTRRWHLVAAAIIILAVGVVLGYALPGHGGLLSRTFHLLKGLVVVADVGILYLSATVAWAAYRAPDAASVSEASQKVRSLARMIGALLLLIVTQVLFFCTT